MKTYFRLLCFSVLVFGFIFNNVTFSNEIKFYKVLSTESYNKSITQDKDGIIWISTEGKGLFAYNGSSFKNIKIGVGDVKNSIQTITSMFVDRTGLIWFFIQEQGLYSFDKETNSYTSYRPEEGNPQTLTSNNFSWQPHIIAEDKEGLIWVGTGDGLNSYNKKTGKFTQYKHDPDNSNSLSNNSIWSVIVDQEGLIWVGTEDGLNYYDKNTKTFRCYKHNPNDHSSLSDNYIRTIVDDKEGNLWIGTKYSGIDKLGKKTGKFTNYRHNPDDKNSLSHNEIRHLMVDRYGNVWICNNGNVGLDIYNVKTNSFKHYSYDPGNPDSISSNTSLSCFEDSSGIVWLIDSSGDLTKCMWQKNVFQKYTYNPRDPFSISSNILTRLHEDGRGNIWIGTYKGGMCLYTKNDKFENFHHDVNSFNLPGVSVHSILNASDNNLWIGVKEGYICLFNIGTKQIVKSFRNPYRKLTPAYLVQDNSNPNILWFACSYAGGIFRFDTVTGQFTVFKHNPIDESSVSSKITFSMLQDGNILWIATGGDGLCKFDKYTGKCIYYRQNINDKNSISGNVVIESFIDSKGNFWVTTEDGGLNKFDRGTEHFLHYGVGCGFPSNSTRHILEDKLGYLWISTDSGIVKFDPQELKVIKRFTIADGLPSDQFDKFANPLKDSNGFFWFSTLKGLCRFNPEDTNKIQPNSHIPPIILLSLETKEGTYKEDGTRRLTSVKLPWPDNSFEFTFTALDYTDPDKNQYAYKLEGFDKDWKYIGTNNFGQYSNLNPGEYTLRLKGANNDAVWNEDGISIKIIITPPFWMASWFKALTGITILCLIVGVFNLVVKGLKKKAIFARNYLIAGITAQVAHDIRSPLAALNTALRDLRELPEQKRILIRHATHRISDIANNLLLKYKIRENDLIPYNAVKEIEAELVSSLLDSLISEKRIQVLEKAIDIVLDLGPGTHSCFVELESEKFKRSISNLINNAAEAIETKGSIRVVLTKQVSDLRIEVIDSAQGIPDEILLKINKGEMISNKKGGCGLGISSAIQNIKSWNGHYSIKSEKGIGTIFAIQLPIAREPDWFQSNITLSTNTHIVVVDDDQSIHNIWEAHFHEYIENKLVIIDHFYDLSFFTEYCKTIRSERDLFLVDYEFVNSKETGLDMIKLLNLSNAAVLVTSRYEEPEIKEQVKNLGIKVIPKSFAPYIPITILNNVGTKNQTELIFIDDDKTLTEVWELQANFVDKKIATFNHSEDFKKVMNLYDRNIPIYIDSDLKEHVPGEVFAKFLHEQGFQNLYLATGYEKDKFGKLPWIKEIVTKEAPF